MHACIRYIVPRCPEYMYLNYMYLNYMYLNNMYLNYMYKS